MAAPFAAGPLAPSPLHRSPTPAARDTDSKLNRTFLRRTRVEGVTLDQLYEGSSLHIFGRLMTVLGFADDFTRNRLSLVKQRTFAMEMARHLRPGSLRARFGVDRVQMGLHCSDLPEDGPLESCVIEYSSMVSGSPHRCRRRRCFARSHLGTFPSGGGGGGGGGQRQEPEV
ncbi:Nucleoside diphosphate kinase 7 [Gryllus bimaculatus]|nr:Nucleoside diphosphate kinase 7 [Gryllus bimaculatus]